MHRSVGSNLPTMKTKPKSTLKQDPSASSHAIPFPFINTSPLLSQLCTSPKSTTIHFFKLDNPSPPFLTTFLSKISTFLLSSSLNSGLMIFGLRSWSSALFRVSLAGIFPLPLFLAGLLSGLTEVVLGPELPRFVPPAVTASTPEVLAVLSPGEAAGEVGSDWPLPNEAFLIGLWRNFGAGKFAFLSIASTLRWKRRKSASARISVDSRSIVLESSLTSSISSIFPKGRPDYLPYFKTSSKCWRCAMMTSLCFSKIANATNRWKLLLKKSVQRTSQRCSTSSHWNSLLYHTSSMRKKKKKFVESALWRCR